MLVAWGVGVQFIKDMVPYQLISEQQEMEAVLSPHYVPLPIPKLIPPGSLLLLRNLMKGQDHQVELLTKERMWTLQNS